MTKQLFFLGLMLILSITNYAQVAVNSDASSPNADAMLDVKSTNSGLLIPRLALTGTANVAPLANHVAGMLVYNTATAGDVTPGFYYNDGSKWVKVGDAAKALPDGTQSGDMLYWNGTAWVNVAVGNEGQVLTLVSGVPTWTTTASATDVTNPSTGKIWMARNLGASRVATSSTDANAYGDLYQWGRAADGHQIRTSGTTTTLATSDTPGHANFILNNSISPYDWRNPQNDNLWQGVSGINNPCPSGYRIPTETEWQNERQSWATDNAAGAFGSPLRLTLGGYRYNGSGTLDLVGSYGHYWSSTISNTFARYLEIYSNSVRMYSYYRGAGSSVRCIKN